MDVTVVLLLILQSFRGTELLEPSAQPTNFSLPENDGFLGYVSILFGNETENIFSFQENITLYNTTNATMNNADTGLDTESNETWRSIEDMSDDGITLDNGSTNDTNLNITDTKDINTNNTDTNEDEMGSNFIDVDSGEATPSPGTNITKSNNPEDITAITTIATTNDINSTTSTNSSTASTNSSSTTTRTTSTKSSSTTTRTTSTNSSTITTRSISSTTTTRTTSTNSSTTTTRTTSTNSSTTPKEGLDDRRDIGHTESNRAVDSAGSNTRSSNSTAWAIVIGTALAVGIVSLIVFIRLKRRGHRHLNHRKLVEDLPTGPVFRVDSYENLGMGTLSFDNPALQGDDIHMDYMAGTQDQH